MELMPRINDAVILTPRVDCAVRAAEVAFYSMKLCGYRGYHERSIMISHPSALSAICTLS